MNYYPDAEVYLITWLGGSCGAFLTSLVYEFVFDTKEPKIFSKHGNAHANLKRTNWRPLSDQIGYSPNVVKIYECVVPKDPAKPTIFYDHLTPDWNKLFAIYPKCKNIIISVSPEDQWLVSRNLFLKYNVDCHVPGKEDSEKNWTERKNNSKVLREFASPDDIPSELITKMFSPCTDIGRYEYPFADDSVIPEEYADRVFHIKMNDLLNNKAAVLNTLSEITSRPITDELNTMYDQYLEKQQFNSP